MELVRGRSIRYLRTFTSHRAHLRPHFTDSVKYRHGSPLMPRPMRSILPTASSCFSALWPVAEKAPDIIAKVIVEINRRGAGTSMAASPVVRRWVAVRFAIPAPVPGCAGGDRRPGDRSPGHVGKQRLYDRRRSVGPDPATSGPGADGSREIHRSEVYR